MTSAPPCQRILDRRDRVSDWRVLTLGGANVEHGYSLAGELEADAKYTIDPQPRLAGGSSVNHSCRLLAMGIGVHPVLPLAASDPLSGVILEALGDAAAVGGARFEREALEVEGPSLRTPYTTIIRQGGSRAVLNEFSPELMQAFEAHVERHLARIASADAPDVVMLGHVHADREKPPSGDVGFAGAISERILTAPELGGARKYVNFGSAQFAQGTRRWERVLRDHVDVFQLDIGEVRRFCRDAELADASLASILGWFRERCTVVVSLERFGAIGQQVGSDRPVAAWPYLIESVADSTGAGDAMGAGIVASMAVDPFDVGTGQEERGLEAFAAALAFGRACGAHACTTVGGATHCPSLESLADFERAGRLPGPGRGMSIDVSEHDLFLIDRAFDR